MVKQGTIIKTDFGPVRGHEQSGYRPALVVSDSKFAELSNLVLACPITGRKRDSVFHIALGDELLTTGYVMANQAKALDLRTRKFTVVERVPREIAEKVSGILKGLVDIGDDYDGDDEDIQTED